MNTLPDLSQLTHEQLLEFTRQLAMQHQQLAEDKPQLDAQVQHLEVSNQELEKSNQQLDAKVQHLSILNQNTSMNWRCLNSINSAVKTNISPQNKSICGMRRSKKISQPLIWN